MDTKETYTQTDIIDKLILIRIKQVLTLVTKEYEITGEIDKALNNEIVRIDWEIHKLNEKKALKLRASMTSKKCPIHGLTGKICLNCKK